MLATLLALPILALRQPSTLGELREWQSRFLRPTFALKKTRERFLGVRNGIPFAPEIHLAVKWINSGDLFAISNPKMIPVRIVRIRNSGTKTDSSLASCKWIQGFMVITAKMTYGELISQPAPASFGQREEEAPFKNQ